MVQMMYECSMVAVRKHHSSASNNVTYSSIFLEAESLKSRCWQRMNLVKVLGGSNFFQLLRLLWLVVTQFLPLFSYGCLSVLCLCAHLPSPLCIGVYNSTLVIWIQDTPQSYMTSSSAITSAMTLFAKEENGHISLEDIFEPIIDSNIKMEGKK